MNKVQKLHSEAMSLAEKAAVEQTHGKTESARPLFEAAYEKERNAAELLETNFELEPTRSILYRSAASLALDCSDKKGAEKLIEKGLMGDPPLEIVTELRDLLKQVYFQPDRKKQKEVIVPPKERVRSTEVNKLKPRLRRLMAKPLVLTMPEIIQDIEEQKKYTCFVAMPFDKDANRIYKHGIQSTINKFRNSKITLKFDRADYSLKDLRLWDNVRKKLQDADFIIADLTGANPNVLYELGYARALDKRAIHITRTPRHELADVKGWYYIPYKLRALRELSSRLARYIIDVTAIIDARVQLDEFTVNAYRHRQAVDIDGLIRDTREGIDIYTTNVSDFLSPKYTKSLVRTMTDHPVLQIRFLTMDPESDLVSRRARQLNINTYSYRKELRENLKKLNEIGSQFSDRFSIRLYDDLPTQITFRFDRKIVTAVVSTVTRSRRNIHFVLDTQQAGVTESFIYHFEVIWGRGYPVPQYMLV